MKTYEKYPPRYTHNLDVEIIWKKVKVFCKEEQIFIEQQMTEKSAPLLGDSLEKLISF